RQRHDDVGRQQRIVGGGLGGRELHLSPPRLAALAELAPLQRREQDEQQEGDDDHEEEQRAAASGSAAAPSERPAAAPASSAAEAGRAASGGGEQRGEHGNTHGEHAIATRS